MSAGARVTWSWGPPITVRPRRTLVLASGLLSRCPSWRPAGTRPSPQPGPPWCATAPSPRTVPSATPPAAPARWRPAPFGGGSGDLRSRPAHTPRSPSPTRGRPAGCGPGVLASGRQPATTARRAPAGPRRHGHARRCEGGPNLVVLPRPIPTARVDATDCNRRQRPGGNRATAGRSTRHHCTHSTVMAPGGVGSQGDATRSARPCEQPQDRYTTIRRTEPSPREGGACDDPEQARPSCFGVEPAGLR